MVQGSVEKTSQRTAGGPEAEDLTQNARYKCNEQRYGCHSGQYKRNLTTPSGNIIFKVSPHQQWEKDSLIWRHGPAQRFPSRR
ncbi:hypothetical protein I4200191B4_07430 [Pseudoflavonifractor gallinarum]